MTTDAKATDAALQGLIGYRLRRAWIGIRADLAETLKPFDLRMLTYTALVLIDGNPRLSQAQLADLMDVERPNLVAIIDELSKRGLVHRRRDVNDRRAYALELSAKGQTLCHEATDAVQRHEDRLFGSLTAADRRAISAALALIAERT